MVYLLHFREPYKGVQHYIGFAETPATFKRRLEHHRKGTGAKLMHAVAKAGIEFDVAVVWEDGDRNFERQLKNKKHSSRICPLCALQRNLSFTTPKE